MSRLESMELALAAARGAQEELEQLLDEAYHALRSPMISDAGRVAEVLDLLKAWRGDDDR